MLLNGHLKIITLSLIFMLCIANTEPAPIFDHLKKGWDQAHGALHRLGCKIKDHKGCEHSTTEVATTSPITTMPPEEMIDIRSRDDELDIVGYNEKSQVTAIDTNDGNSINKIEGKNIISVNTCANGFRRDRTGKCREIV